MKATQISKSLVTIGAVLTFALPNASAWTKSYGNGVARATLSMDAYDYGSSSSYGATAYARATARVFSFSGDLVHARSTLTLDYAANRGRLYTYAKAFGRTLVNNTKSSTTSGSVTLLRPTWRTIRTNGPRVSVGGVGISCNAGLSAFVGAVGQWNIQRSASGYRPKIEVRALPFGSVSVWADASVSMAGFGAGVSGAIELASIRPDVKASFVPYNYGRDAYGRLTATIPYVFGRGSLRPYIKGLWQKVYGSSILSWNGYSGTFRDSETITLF